MAIYFVRSEGHKLNNWLLFVASYPVAVYYILQDVQQKTLRYGRFFRACFPGDEQRVLFYVFADWLQQNQISASTVFCNAGSHYLSAFFAPSKPWLYGLYLYPYQQVCVAHFTFNRYVCSFVCGLSLCREAFCQTVWSVTRARFVRSPKSVCHGFTQKVTRAVTSLANLSISRLSVTMRCNGPSSRSTAKP